MINWEIGENGYLELVNVGSYVNVKDIPKFIYINNINGIGIFKMVKDKLGNYGYPYLVSLDDIKSEFTFKYYRKPIWFRFNSDYVVMLPNTWDSGWDLKEIPSFEIYVEEVDKFIVVTLKPKPSTLENELTLDFVVDGKVYYTELIKGEGLLNFVVDYENYYVECNLKER